MNIQHLEEVLENYKKGSNKAYKELANYLLNYTKDFNDLTINTISSDLFISSAVPTRFAQHMGLSGFNELKILLKNNKLKINDSIDHYVNSNLDLYLVDIVNSIEGSLKLLSNCQLDNVVNKIIAASRIKIFAVGGSHSASTDFYYKLLRLNFAISNQADRHVQYYMAKISSKEDVAIGISYSGTTTEVIKSLNTCKENGCYTLLITSNLSISANTYDDIIYIAHSELSNKIFSITSRTSIISILDIIYLHLLNKDSVKYYSLLKKSKYKSY